MLTLFKIMYAVQRPCFLLYAEFVFLNMRKSDWKTDNAIL